jgi:hypothetical protein
MFFDVLGNPFHKRFIDKPDVQKVNLDFTSVADPDPGSGIGGLLDPWIRDPGSGIGDSQHPDPGSAMNNPDHIF